jgi:hypothetical protein
MTESHYMTVLLYEIVHKLRNREKQLEQWISLQNIPENFHLLKCDKR